MPAAIPDLGSTSFTALGSVRTFTASRNGAVCALAWFTLSCSASDNSKSNLAEVGGQLNSNGVGGMVASSVGQSASSGGSSVGGNGVGGIGFGGNSLGGDSSVAGAPATDNLTDLAEKGLCAIAIGCSSAIVDSPAVLCTFELRDAAGATVYSDHASVELRGRSSLKFPKKNYGIELKDASGLDKPANLLGMGQDEDWVLDGAWADRSFMRNRLSYGLFRDMGAGRWAPQVRYCELTLNGAYAGLYALIEKIKRDDDRVVLPDDDGTGSTFIVKQDDDGALQLDMGDGDLWQIVYPSKSGITATQTQAVQNWLNQLGAALSSTAPNGLLNLLEPAAVIDWILLEEFSKNVDAYNLSLFFARSSGGLAWIVPWDMDLAYGQPLVRNTTNDSAQGWVINRTNLISKLSGVASIRQGLGPRWRELRTGVFAEAAIMTRLDGYAAILPSEATDKNSALWPMAQVDLSIIYSTFSGYTVATHAEEATRLRNWIRQRLTWLDANIDTYPSR